MLDENIKHVHLEAGLIQPKKMGEAERIHPKNKWGTGLVVGMPRAFIVNY
jgi:hypothetical protein